MTCVVMIVVTVVRVFGPVCGVGSFGRAVAVTVMFGVYTCAGVGTVAASFFHFVIRLASSSARAVSGV